MVAYRTMALAVAAAALPLNINLGAYSPALVVGDGEINFGGNQDVSNLMSVLQGAAVNAASGAATNNGAEGAQGAQGTAPVAQPAEAQPVAAEQTAAAAAASTQVASATMSSVDPTLQEQAQQIAALQGMGKEIAPRHEVEDVDVARRDLSGFDRALQYAEASLTKSPTVALGTGAHGAGVGIVVGGAAGPIKKRQLGSSSKVKVTTMYVHSGLPASLQNGGTKMVARDMDLERRIFTPIQIAAGNSNGKVGREANPGPSTIDAVNLNMNGEQGITMTFVETVDDSDDE